MTRIYGKNKIYFVEKDKVYEAKSVGAKKVELVDKAKKTLLIRIAQQSGLIIPKIGDIVSFTGSKHKVKVYGLGSMFPLTDYKERTVFIKGKTGGVTNISLYDFNKQLEVNHNVNKTKKHDEEATYCSRSVKVRRIQSRHKKKSKSFRVRGKRVL